MVVHWIGRGTCDLHQFGSRGGSGFWMVGEWHGAVWFMFVCGLGGSGGVGEAHSHLSNSVDVQGWWGSGVHWHGLGGGLGMVAHWIGRVTCDLYQFGSRGGSGF